jgi:hypothetical protein
MLFTVWRAGRDGDDRYIAVDEAMQLFDQELAKARIDEARYWDGKIMGSPRSVVANEKAKRRIAELSPQPTVREEK